MSNQRIFVHWKLKPELSISQKYFEKTIGELHINFINNMRTAAIEKEIQFSLTSWA
jgi:hypothetical protein